ncbi:peptide-methionine (S)-S-oxide reductase [Candidatus Gottesmanbacteria bacterium RBG_16_52_11]|uniref:Peptide methionine sulfoxide reductase MsrA n=1 Tax=Candidatus Gottesmanbacteria bacterium RBG_16_52_11 TaxID=1798374 RepID=A0A1F5YXJ0_9BACT|nr:MAG: peptide-methionine (S)-S-oxide reductase [Candidatus Gottesmanbacteria bacterium RBG_16_52_11]
MKTKTAYFGGGCFWCTEAVFRRLRGVCSVTPGYAGGTSERPDYRSVTTGKTGHAETVRVEYDPGIISYSTLLDVFFTAHDPTTLNRQGADAGSQYRSIVLYTGNAQKAEAEDAIRKINDSGKYPDPVVTQVVPFTVFFPAEAYHLGYYEKNREAPYCRIVIDPKITGLYETFPDILKNDRSSRSRPV